MKIFLEFFEIDIYGKIQQLESFLILPFPGNGAKNLVRGRHAGFKFINGITKSNTTHYTGKYDPVE